MCDDKYNVTTIQAYDEYCSKVIEKSSSAHVYCFNTETVGWTKTKIGGVFFLYKRTKVPFYAFMVLSRKSKRLNQIEYVTPNVQLQLNTPFMLYKSGEGEIYSIWFFSVDDCERITKKIGELIQSLGGPGLKLGSPNELSDKMLNNDIIQYVRKDSTNGVNSSNKKIDITLQNDFDKFVASIKREQVYSAKNNTPSQTAVSNCIQKLTDLQFGDERDNDHKPVPNILQLLSQAEAVYKQNSATSSGNEQRISKPEGSQSPKIGKNKSKGAKNLRTVTNKTEKQCNISVPYNYRVSDLENQFLHGSNQNNSRDLKRPMDADNSSGDEVVNPSGGNAANLPVVSPFLRTLSTATPLTPAAFTHDAVANTSASTRPSRGVHASVSGATGTGNLNSGSGVVGDRGRKIQASAPTAVVRREQKSEYDDEEEYAASSELATNGRWRAGQGHSRQPRTLQANSLLATPPMPEHHIEAEDEEDDEDEDEHNNRPPLVTPAMLTALMSDVAAEETQSNNYLEAFGTKTGKGCQTKSKQAEQTTDATRNRQQQQQLHPNRMQPDQVVDGLTKSQFKEALIHMLQDDEFLGQIHTAYFDALQRRLTKRV